MSFYRTQLEDFLKGLDVKANVVFDIGGGQKAVKGRTRSWEVKTYKILDLPEFDLERSYCPGGNLIFCLEVFEYLIKPLDAMINIEHSLLGGGRAYISFPLSYPVHNEVEFDSLRYTESGIRRLVANAKMKVKNIHYRKDKSGLLSAFYISDGMRAAKGIDHSITGYIVEVEK